MNITIVGRGKVGSSLRAALLAAGARVRMQQGRAERLRIAAGTELVILCVPDAVLHAVAERLEAPRMASVIHVAGARGLEELLSLRSKGLTIGVMHPLVSFAGAKRSSFEGATFVCDGERAALQKVRALCKLLGARWVLSQGHGPAYHAAAALTANGAAALADASSRILVALGWKERTARFALAGLLRSVAENVERVGVPAALTGPIARGDAATVRLHLRALAPLGARLAATYATAAPLILACAARAGLPPRDQARIRAALMTTGKQPSRPKG